MKGLTQYFAVFKFCSAAYFLPLIPITNVYNTVALNVIMFDFVEFIIQIYCHVQLRIFQCYWSFHLMRDLRFECDRRAIHPKFLTLLRNMRITEMRKMLISDEEGVSPYVDLKLHMRPKDTDKIRRKCI